MGTPYVGCFKGCQSQLMLMNSPLGIVKVWLSPPRRLTHDVNRMMWLSRHGMRIAAKMASNRIFYRYGCCISPNAKIASDVLFPHPTGIVIGEGVSIGSGCTVYQNVTIGSKNSGYPQIGSSCRLYASSIILGDICLASDVTVGANSLVLRDCAIPGAVLVGSPAKMLGRS